jgi:hypothetical protein
MGTRNYKNRNFVLIFVLATAMHLLLLLIPVVRQQATDMATSPALTIRLSRPQAPAPQPEPPPEVLTEPAPVEPSRLEPVTPARLAELPADEPKPATSPRFDPYQVLSDIRERQKTDPLASSHDNVPAERPDYYVYQRPVLEEVLNEPSLQLPFRDTRIYLVNTYDEGFAGSVQRFFDDVTVPFGFTTRNNTRVQCAWFTRAVTRPVREYRPRKLLTVDPGWLYPTARANQTLFNP